MAIKLPSRLVLRGEDLPLLVLPTIVTEDYDSKMVLPDDHVSERERMRSLLVEPKSILMLIGLPAENPHLLLLTDCLQTVRDDAHGKDQCRLCFSTH
ncbi:hypothetical protein TNIN_287411 [Trichonephila inaurata madagascariensis]|uniref:Uncharacterized protein n=1 Tax=Trichonephila inaurata madagascariensis TaxID=2747483 RepID=A0A8X6YNG2_9ARAC|nr:hypothetical protein TNIN_287411 [Trichonephila inaurata madagascariensis]